MTTLDIHTDNTLWNTQLGSSLILIINVFRSQKLWFGKKK
jgi:hypothetical protein